MPWWQQLFFQVTLPIIVSFVLATWYQSSRITDLSNHVKDLREVLGKRIDDLRSDTNTSLNEVNARVGAVEKRLERLEDGVAKLTSGGTAAQSLLVRAFSPYEYSQNFWNSI